MVYLHIYNFSLCAQIFLHASSKWFVIYWISNSHELIKLKKILNTSNARGFSQKKVKKM